MNGLRDLGDQLKAKIGEGVIVLISDCDGKVNMVAWQHRALWIRELMQVT